MLNLIQNNNSHQKVNSAALLFYFGRGHSLLDRAGSLGKWNTKDSKPGVNGFSLLLGGSCLWIIIRVLSACSCVQCGKIWEKQVVTTGNNLHLIISIQSTKLPGSLENYRNTSKTDQDCSPSLVLARHQQLLGLSGDQHCQLPFRLPCLPHQWAIIAADKTSMVLTQRWEQSWSD